MGMPNKQTNGGEYVPRRSIINWLAGFALVTALYCVGPAVYFNRATPLILGMPTLYFWFVLIPGTDGFHSGLRLPH